MAKGDGHPNRTDGGPAGGCSGNSDCKASEFCYLKTGCLGGAKAGTCTARPVACKEIWDPVCGCDGKTYSSTCHAGAQGVNTSHDGVCQQDPACKNVTCKVLNDCCGCRAIHHDVYPSPCLASCKQPVCQGWGIHTPQAYCVKGQCLLTSGKATCTKDTDCRMINECCYCTALHKSIPTPPCAMDCDMGRCTSMGLGAANVRCVGGICKMVGL